MASFWQHPPGSRNLAGSLKNPSISGSGGRKLQQVDKLYLAKWNNISPTWTFLKFSGNSLTFYHHLGEIGRWNRSRANLIRYIYIYIHAFSHGEKLICSHLTHSFNLWKRRFFVTVNLTQYQKEGTKTPMGLRWFSCNWNSFVEICQALKGWNVGMWTPNKKQPLEISPKISSFLQLEIKKNRLIKKTPLLKGFARFFATFEGLHMSFFGGGENSSRTSHLQKNEKTLQQAIACR